LGLAGQVLAIVCDRGPEPEDGDGDEPLAVLHQLVQRPHPFRNHHIPFVEPSDLWEDKYDVIKRYPRLFLNEGSIISEKCEAGRGIKSDVIYEQFFFLPQQNVNLCSISPTIF
jgi:hypothetical protein